MSKLTCEKVERELELNGQKAKFVASTLNLDYVIIDKTLYLGLDYYDKVIKDVRAEFASDEAISTRAERIVAANAAFSFVVAKEYGDCQIAVYAKENLGYVALHLCENLLYVQFAWGTNFGQDKINKIPTMDMEENCKTNIEKYKEQLSNTYQDRYSNFVWFQDRYKDEQVSHTRDVSVEECCEVSFVGACLHCGEHIDYSFSVDESCITECKECGAVFSVFTEVIATATHNVKRIR